MKAFTKHANFCRWRSKKTQEFILVQYISKLHRKLENTEELLDYFRSLGIPCKYELNPGNHFQDVNLRCAKGILELLR